MHWQRLLISALNGEFGKTVQRASYVFVVSSVICLSVFGVRWGVNLVFSACVWTASQFIVPMFHPLQHIGGLNLTHHLPPAGQARITPKSG
jgi:hypothetical protein